MTAPNQIPAINGYPNFLGLTQGPRLNPGAAPAVGFGASQPLEAIPGNLNNSGMLKPVVANDKLARNLDMEA